MATWLHTYLCAYDFEVEDEDFAWEECGESFAERDPQDAAEEFLKCRAGVERVYPGPHCVVVFDQETGEATRWDVELEITCTALPAVE